MPDFSLNIKYYHIILISIILSPLLITNSNNVLKKRNQEKLNKEAETKFNQIIFGRYLESFQEGMYEIWNRTSDELKNYNLNKAIEKFDETVKTEDSSDSNPEYIEALIDIVKSSTEKDSDVDIVEKGKI